MARVAFGHVGLTATHLHTSPHPPQDGSHTYQLAGVIQHHGDTLASGHYIALVCDDERRWWRTSDNDVTRIELQQVLSGEAYIVRAASACVCG